jgi:hypothetical protein
MCIPLRKRIVITGNEEVWNEIIILIPSFCNNTYATIGIDSKLLKKLHNFLFFKKKNSNLNKIK